MVQLIKKQGIRSLRLSRLNTPKRKERSPTDQELEDDHIIPGGRPVLRDKRLYFT
ncbi:hypothetical protein MKW92_023280, partial [Papaver armeniacum]